VTPPDGFTCTQASPCRGEGVCRARRCVEPAERPLSPTTGAAPAPVLVTGERLVLEDDSVHSTLDGRELEPPMSGRWSPARWGGVAEPTGARFRLGLNMLDDRPEVITLSRTERGVRTEPVEWQLGLASELSLTASGDALVVTSGSQADAEAETRVRQLDALGRERMSCPLVDEPAPGAASGAPLRLGPVTAYTGWQLAVANPRETCCQVCDCNARHWEPPRLVFYELGPSAPALATSGWVSRRGTPGGGSRAR
jgi:hypothetical protein